MRALPAALVLFAASCGSPTEPTRPTLQFTGLIVFGIPTLETTALGLEGGIDVTGVLPTPSATYTLFGKLEFENGRLVLNIDAYDNRPGAPFPVQNYYVGRIRHLPAGEYDLQVFETLHVGAAQKSSVLHQTVQVP